MHPGRDVIPIVLASRSSNSHHVAMFQLSHSLFIYSRPSLQADFKYDVICSQVAGYNSNKQNYPIDDAFRGRHALASLPAGIWAFDLIEIWIKTTRNFPVGNRCYGLLILWRRSSNGENVLAGCVASTADTLTDLTTNKGRVAESNINWEHQNTDRSAMFTSVVSASKRHAHYNGRGSIPNMSCYYKCALSALPGEVCQRFYIFSREIAQWFHYRVITIFVRALIAILKKMTLACI